MMNNILSAILYLSLIITLFLGAYTLNRCESRKRTSFIALLATVFLYVLGYLLEITAYSTDGGFIAVKVMYLGSTFVAPVYLLFTADYCDIKINKKLIAVLLIIPMIIITLVWTTSIHKLIYTSYTYNTASEIHHLAVTRGPLYYIVHIYATICTTAIVAILILRLRAWGSRYRTNLVLLLIGAMIPTLVNVIFIFNFRLSGLNYTPMSMIVLNVLFYINIVRHNLLDIIPRASEMAMESIKEAFIIVDLNGNLINANESAKKLFPEIKNLKKDSPVNQIRDWPTELRLPGTGEESPTVKFEMPGDSYYSATVSPIIDKNDAMLGRIILIQDITESVLLTKKLEEFAYIDALTGILNRRHFMSLASTQIERSKRLGTNSFLVIFDIDHFKKVNDTHGHPLGDKVLQCLAERVKDAIRPYDLFGRYGGEEFVLLISDIDEESVKSHTERIRLAINDSPMVFGDLQLMISASFGVASVISAQNLEAAIKSSDEALYRAKNEGRNRVVLANN